MSEKTKYRIVDGLLIAMMILPFVFCIVLKILLTPLSEGITVNGAQIYFAIDMQLQELPITASQAPCWPASSFGKTHATSLISKFPYLNFFYRTPIFSFY